MDRHRDLLPPEPDALEELRQQVEAAFTSRSWSEALLDSEHFRNYHSGRVEVEVPGPLEPVCPSGQFELRQAAPPAPPGSVTTADLAGPAHRYEAPLPPRFPRPLLDMVGRETVETGVVTYDYLRPFPAAAAAEVPEGTAKPPMALALESHRVELATYAHWKAITRQVLEDYPRLRAIIETYLREGLLESLERAVAEAVVADSEGAVSHPSLLVAVRMGIAELDGYGYRPTALLVNAADLATMEVLVTAESGRRPASRPIWGLAPVTSPVCPRGTAYVGDLRRAVTLFDRGRTTLAVTDSHDGFFVENKLVLLAETRALVALVEPVAVVKVTGSPDLVVA